MDKLKNKYINFIVTERKRRPITEIMQMTCMAGVVETSRNPNHFDSRMVDYIKYRIADGFSGDSDKLYTLYKTDTPNDGLLENEYEIRTDDEILDFQRLLFEPVRPETLFIAPGVGNSKTGYIIFYPVEDGTNTVDVLDLDHSEKMVDLCGQACEFMSLGQIIDHAASILENEDSLGEN